MAPPAPWASIPPELLLLISGGLTHLESYSSARGVCTAWRAALPPPIPSLLTVSADDPDPHHYRHRPRVSAVFLQARRSFPLAALRGGGSRCVGSSNGWLAVDSRPYYQGPTAYYPYPEIYLVIPFSGGGGGEGEVVVPLLPLRNDGKPVPKIVFAPRLTPEDYVAVAICDLRRLAYTKTRDMKWMILDVPIGERDRLVDLAFDAGAGRVYCVTLLGDVHVLHIPRRQRRRPVIEPLAERVAGGGLPYDPAAAYAPPYDTASKLTGAKHVFFFGGDLYQVWRNTSTCAVSWAMHDGGGRFGMTKDEVFVLKYDPERRPCWDVVKDLGGCSVFVGKNQPVVLRPEEDAPALRPNCVYWINEQSAKEPMVFDMATGIVESQLFILPPTKHSIPKAHQFAGTSWMTR
ncbi:unnamed protein product [Urochloa decumbens]|uniref:KIB1-4 beta-propeller domain-containing protein n=1 Tax=Urochloa decumbens TaxID=240449 RepID=A0ABC9CWC5_9POAL